MAQRADIRMTHYRWCSWFPHFSSVACRHVAAWSGCAMQPWSVSKTPALHLRKPFAKQKSTEILQRLKSPKSWRFISDLLEVNLVNLALQTEGIAAYGRSQRWQHALTLFHDLSDSKIGLQARSFTGFFWMFTVHPQKIVGDPIWQRKTAGLVNHTFPSSFPEIISKAFHEFQWMFPCSHILTWKQPRKRSQHTQGFRLDAVVLSAFVSSLERGLRWTFTLEVLRRPPATPKPTPRGLTSSAAACAKQSEWTWSLLLHASGRFKRLETMTFIWRCMEPP